MTDETRYLIVGDMRAPGRTARLWGARQAETWGYGALEIAMRAPIAGWTVAL